MSIHYIYLIILLLLSGFFSGSETAFMAVNRVKIKDMANEGDLKAQNVEELLKNETRLLTTILIGNNLVNIASSAIATAIAIELFGNKGVGIATGVVTFLILVFGEITPKSLGNKKAIKFSRFVSSYLLLLEKLLSPVIKVFTVLIERFIGESNLIKSAFLSEEEIRRFVNVSEEEGVIKEIESEMIHSIFDFDDTLVREIMVPRIDIVCISKEATIEEIVEVAVENGHSRIPVYENNIDDIGGLIYVKDLLNLILKDDKEYTLEDFIKPIYFIPETKPINQLLAEMKRRKEHMAIVLDEYGGTSGLITIEDLLEEIVGDIQDEYDLEPQKIELLNEKELMVEGAVDIDKINQILPEPLPDSEEYETISGLVLHYLGYFPDEGEKIDINNYTVKIDEIIEHRIEKIKIVSENKIEVNNRDDHIC